MTQSDKDDLSENQRTTTQLLSHVLGKTFADRYTDACRLASGAVSLRVSRPMAAHAMREFESSLREVLTIHGKDTANKPTAIPQKTLRLLNAALKKLGFDAGAIQRARKAVEPQGNQRTQILKILTWLGFQNEDQVSQAWLALTNLSKTAHKRSFHQMLNVDDEFRVTLQDPFQLVVHEVASALKRRYSALMLRVESLTSMSDKTAAVTLFKGEIPGAPPLQWHFFECLSDPTWLPALAKAQLLDPPSEYTISPFPFGPWPAGRYLLRMAGSEDPDVRKQIVNTLSQPRLFWGPDTQTAVFDILVVLPPNEAAPFASTVANWLDQKIRHMSMHVPIRLVAKFADSGETSAALTVARSLLQVLDGQEGIDTLFTRGMYEYCLPDLVTTLTTACGIDALSLFIDLLRQASIVSGKLVEAPPTDRTEYTGRPIADDESAAYDVYSALIRGVRTSAEILIEHDPSSTRAVVNKLISASVNICKRIAIHVLAKKTSGSPELAESWLTDVNLLEDSQYKSEYGALALAWYPSLPPKQQESIISLVRGIPSRYRDAWRRHREHAGQPIGQEDEVAFDALTVMEATWEWRAVLPAPFKEELEANSQRYGIPGAWKRATHFLSERSPLQAADFSSRSILEIANFLTDWQPQDGTSKTKEALAHEWRLAVQLQPDRYASEADRFASIPPLFLEQLLDRLSNGAKNGNVFLWSPVLELVGNVLSQLMKHATASGTEHLSNEHWLPVCRSICELLKTGLLPNPAAIAFQHATTLDALIVSLLDLMPQAMEIDDFEIRFTRDAFLTARETLQGSALELAMWWLSWNSRNNASPIAIKPDSALAPPSVLAQKILKQITSGPRGSISRAILGRYLGWIYHFGPEWTLEHLDQIFDTTSSELLEAAWSAYILHSGYPVESLYPRLRKLYDQESYRVAGDAPDSENGTFRATQFGKHLLALYLDSVLDFSEPVLQRFLQQTSPQQRRHLILDLNQYARSAPDRVSDAKHSRGLAYWEARLRAASAAKDRGGFSDEIEAFGHWIGNPRLETSWALRQLSDMLSAGFMPSIAYSVVDWIAQVCSENIDLSVQILEKLIEHDEAKPDLYMTQRTAIRTILVNALDSEVAAVASTVNRIVSVLATIGETGYLDLVPRQST